MGRAKPINWRSISPECRAAVEALASKRGVSMSHVLTDLVRAAAATELGLDVPPVRPAGNPLLLARRAAKQAEESGSASAVDSGSDPTSDDNA